MGLQSTFPLYTLEEELVIIGRAYDVYMCVRNESAPKNHPNFAVMFDGGKDPAIILQLFRSKIAAKKFTQQIGKYLGENPLDPDNLRMMSAEELGPKVAEAADYAFDVYLEFRANRYKIPVTADF